MVGEVDFCPLFVMFTFMFGFRCVIMLMFVFKRVLMFGVHIYSYALLFFMFVL